MSDREFWWAWKCAKHGFEPHLFATRNECAISLPGRWVCGGYDEHGNCRPAKVKLIEVKRAR